MNAKYWVHDASRLCRVTLGAEPAAEAAREGFREVTPEEQDTFRAVTRRDFAHLLNRGRKG